MKKLAFCLLCALCLTACGDNFEQASSSQSAPSSSAAGTTAENTTAASTTEAAESETAETTETAGTTAGSTSAETASSAESAGTVTEAPASDVPAEVIETANKGIAALNCVDFEDAEGLMQYTNILMSVQAGSGLDAGKARESFEEIVQKSKQEGKKTYAVLAPFPFEYNFWDFKLVNPVHASDIEIEKLKVVSQLFQESSKRITDKKGEPYNAPEICVKDAYKFFIDYSNSSLPEDKRDNGAYLFVVNTTADDTYRLDIIYGFIMEAADGLEAIDNQAQADNA